MHRRAGLIRVCRRTGDSTPLREAQKGAKGIGRLRNFYRKDCKFSRLRGNTPQTPRTLRVRAMARTLVLQHASFRLLTLQSPHDHRPTD